jgi:hypothetical protein
MNARLDTNGGYQALSLTVIVTTLPRKCASRPSTEAFCRSPATGVEISSWRSRRARSGWSYGNARDEVVEANE